MLATVERIGVKHAYATTGCYAAAFIQMRSLLADGLIGHVRAIEYRRAGVSLPPTLPYSWWHHRKEGGGMLNGLFTHQLHIPDPDVKTTQPRK